jgi:hypothetical protein
MTEPKPVLAHSELWIVHRRPQDDPEWAPVEEWDWDPVATSEADALDQIETLERICPGPVEHRPVRFVPGEPHTPVDGLMSAWDILEWLASCYLGEGARYTLTLSPPKGMGFGAQAERIPEWVFLRAAEIVGRK